MGTFLVSLFENIVPRKRYSLRVEERCEDLIQGRPVVLNISFWFHLRIGLSTGAFKKTYV